MRKAHGARRPVALDDPGPMPVRDDGRTGNFGQRADEPAGVRTRRERRVRLLRAADPEVGPGYDAELFGGVRGEPEKKSVDWWTTRPERRCDFQ